MLGSGSGKTPADVVREALLKSDEVGALKAAESAFADETSTEGTLAWIAAALYERGVVPGFKLLEAFIERFPDSLHLPRVYFADLLARSSRFDAATDCSRIWLRCASDAGVLAKPLQAGILREGVGKSFLLITSAYTDMGARSYSHRVLTRALSHSLGPKWEAILREEMARLQTELEESANRQADLDWEAFFERGKNADSLFRRCKERGYPLLAKRVDLLEGSFRFDAGFKVGEREFLLLTLTTESGANLLA